MLGMDMLLEGMGIDSGKLQANVETAVAHVKTINDRLAVIEQAATVLVNRSGETLSHVTATRAAALRIEEAIHQLSSGPANSSGFIERAGEDYPAAAQEMQLQIESGVMSNGRGDGAQAGTGPNY